ncbi:MAG: DUF2238 domain-containing protein [Candidatus Sumerlaeota bacterium]|nr:DUF2238 domain-containing protein [Candidatus Sumerlaeota bacterium]
MPPLLKPGQTAILVVNAIGVVGFGAYFLSKANFEFVIYVGVILFFGALLLATNRKVEYPNSVLWGLTAWAFLHMAGGGVFLRGVRLYDVILLPLSRTLPILRYDQFVHVVGFGAATLVMFHLLRPLLRPDRRGWIALSIVVVMAGLGVGALNEIVEFAVSLIVPGSGVGDYQNTALDLVSDLVGAALAMGYVRLSGAE